MSEKLYTESEIKQTFTDEEYGDLIMFIKGGGVAFNVGGKVIVKPVRAWHQLAVDAGSLLRPAVIADARTATAEQLRRGADKHAALREPPTRGGINEPHNETS